MNGRRTSKESSPWARLGLGLLTVLMGLALAVPLLADAREEYKQGIGEFEAGRFGVAAGHFRTAIAERPEERHNLLPARRYYPHYYLGASLAELGDCRGALDEFDLSASQGKIQRSQELFEDLGVRRKACRARLEAVESAFGAVEEALAGGSELAQTLENLGQKPELAAVWGGGLSGRRDEAVQQLDTARRDASAARKVGDLDDLEAARALAADAGQTLQGLVAEARREIGNRNAAASEALDQLEITEGRARRTLRGVAGLAPYGQDLAGRVAALEEVLREVEAGKEEADLEQLEAWNQLLLTARQRVLGASQGPPAWLREAVTAFLAGEYQATLDLLADRGSRKGQAADHACVLTAASLFYRFVETGEQDQILGREAREASRACAEVDLPLKERFFSPRFARFHKAALTTPEEAEGAEGLDGGPLQEDGPLLDTGTIEESAPEPIGSP